MRWKLGIILLGLMVAPLGAAPPGQWQPVDQAVADLDPLATSLRQVSVGLSYQSEQQSSLFVTYRPIAGTTTYERDGLTPVQPVYYRIGSGFRARVERIDYLVRTGRRSYGWNVAGYDGQFIDYPGAGTVYDLTPVPAGQLAPTSTSTTATTTSTPALSGRVEARIDGRVQAQVQTRVDSQIK